MLSYFLLNLRQLSHTRTHTYRSYIEGYAAYCVSLHYLYMLHYLQSSKII
jgi:hypothetical protein